jgi:hypothetical protein
MTGTNPDPSFDTHLKLPADRLYPETVAVRVDVKRIVGCAGDDRAESVEVGVHRGLLVDGDQCGADLGLSASLSCRMSRSVESST